MSERPLELKDAKLCLDCERLFWGRDCPFCGTKDAWVWLSRWVNPIGTPEFVEGENHA